MTKPDNVRRESQAHKHVQPRQQSDVSGTWLGRIMRPSEVLHQTPKGAGGGFPTRFALLGFKSISSGAARPPIYRLRVICLAPVDQDQRPMFSPSLSKCILLPLWRSGAGLRRDPRGEAAAAANEHRNPHKARMKSNKGF